MAILVPIPELERDSLSSGTGLNPATNYRYWDGVFQSHWSQDNISTNPFHQEHKEIPQTGNISMRLKQLYERKKLSPLSIIITRPECCGTSHWGINYICRRKFPPNQQHVTA